MSKFIHISLFLLINGSSFLFAQTSKRNLHTYHLVFQTSVNGSSFSFDSTYQNHWNEAFKVRSFKYYISRLRFVYDEGKTVSLPLAPHLINEADSGSKQITVSAPQGHITAIQFLLGIDSATNVNGVQSDDLDPAKGMFWIWNTGYIMAKFEGSSSSSKAPGKQYSYDIGGYKPGENTAREISLNLPSITNRQPSTFIITADIDKWFYGKNEIKIGSQPMCHSPGSFARQVADNYAAMFSISTE